MSPRHAFAFASILLVASACGPSASPGDDTDEDDDGLDDEDGVDDDDDECTPAAEACSGGEDDDCDGAYDCDDSDCYGVDGCPDCGALDLTEGVPLALPDGVGTSYETAIDFTGFSDGQDVGATTDLLGICVVMEHSWLRDLEIDITCPNGQSMVLQQFLGQVGTELFMGQPNDNDGFEPAPGTGAEYCWSPTATNAPMLTYANENPNVHDLPSGDYRAVEPFDMLLGCPLNGEWIIKVTDLWGEDNGFIFSWGINFNPEIVADCSDWPVE
jgi:hypothetical protein